MLYLAAGESARALVALWRAHEAQPDSALVRLELAKMHFADPDLPGILGFRFLTEARELDPTFVEAWRLTGHACIRWAFWSSGFECFRRVMELEPDHIEAIWNMAAIAQRLGEPHLACRALLALGNLDRTKALELRRVIRGSVEIVARRFASASDG